MKKRSFYISQGQFVTNDEDLDLSQIPSSIKRRLSNIDKISLCLLSKIEDYDFDEIVFSSALGEFERLKSIIEQYKAYNEVSPAQFTGSVHNFPIGCFCQMKKINASYSAISADSNSISTGILQSILSKSKKVLFCCSDFDSSKKGFMCIISKEKINSNSAEYELEEEFASIKNDEFEELKNFLLDNKEEFVSPLFKIKKASR